MKKNIAYLLFLVSFSCTASSNKQPISPLAQYTNLRQRTPRNTSPKNTSPEKENKKQKNAVTGSPSKDKGQKEEVKDFLAKQEMHQSPQAKKILFAAFVVSGIYDGNL